MYLFDLPFINNRCHSSHLWTARNSVLPHFVFFFEFISCNSFIFPLIFNSIICHLTVSSPLSSSLLFSIFFSFALHYSTFFFLFPPFHFSTVYFSDNFRIFCLFLYSYFSTHFIRISYYYLFLPLTHFLLALLIIVIQYIFLFSYSSFVCSQFPLWFCSSTFLSFSLHRTIIN